MSAAAVQAPPPPLHHHRPPAHRPPLVTAAAGAAAAAAAGGGITTTQLHRLLQGLTGRVNELTSRVDLGEAQAQGVREELHRLETLLASKADRRLTAADRFAQQPVPTLTVDEWLAECDVWHWMEELYHGNVEVLATTKPARVLTQVLEAFVDQWCQRMAAEEQQEVAAVVAAPPIRGTMVGKGRILFWFMATNWGAVTGTGAAAATGATTAALPSSSAVSVVGDGNASILLHGATDLITAAGDAAFAAAATATVQGGGGTTLHRAAAAARDLASGAATWRSTTAATDADAMSEITDVSAAYRSGATPRPLAPPAAAAVANTPARSLRTTAAAQPHLVPLEGTWYRMDVRKHWANIVTVLFQKYAEYIDRMIDRAPKAQQLALMTGRAKCCNATESTRMRMAFYDALAKVPGAIL